MQKKIERASFTIEAALVMPVVLLVVFSSLYLCFFVHNRAFLTAAACEAAVCGSMEAVKEEGRPYEAARERSILLGGMGFFGAENIRTYTEAGESEGEAVKVFYELDTVFGPFRIHWHMRTEGSSIIRRPAREIRGMRNGL